LRFLGHCVSLAQQPSRPDPRAFWLGGIPSVGHDLEVFDQDAVSITRQYWSWENAGTGVALSKRADGELQVAEANHTPALIASNANCSWQGINHIGFTLTFDATTSKLLASRPGVGCVVRATSAVLIPEPEPWHDQR